MLEPDVINNIYVTIFNDDVVIGQPYEYKIERLEANQSKNVSFVLLHDLDVVRVSVIYVDLPLNWTHTVEPKNISHLNVSEEKRAIINITPSPDVAAGRYEVRVKTTSLSDEQPISGEDKTINVEIKAETNLLGMIIIILLILGLVGGMVIFGIKLSRR